MSIIPLNEIYDTNYTIQKYTIQTFLEIPGKCNFPRNYLYSNTRSMNIKLFEVNDSENRIFFRNRF